MRFFGWVFHCQPCFKEGLLADLMAEVQKSVAELLAIAHGGEATGNTAANLAASPESRRAAVRIHLFTLLFEDCSRLCVRLVENTDTMQVREQIDGLGYVANFMYLRGVSYALLISLLIFQNSSVQRAREGGGVGSGWLAGQSEFTFSRWGREAEGEGEAHPFRWPSKWIFPHQNLMSRAIKTTGTLIVITGCVHCRGSQVGVVLWIWNDFFRVRNGVLLRSFRIRRRYGK